MFRRSFSFRTSGCFGIAKICLEPREDFSDFALGLVFPVCTVESQLKFEMFI